ncbi:hypothetical protein QQP08_009665 [Theobroma cacao]|nr:hypothetical protein QQP08_009665 [Theobroma cacao]
MLILHIHGSHGQTAGTGSELFSPMMSPTWFIPTIGKGKPCSGKACYIGNSFGFQLFWIQGREALGSSVTKSQQNQNPDESSRGFFMREMNGKDHCNSIHSSSAISLGTIH